MKFEARIWMQFVFTDVALAEYVRLRGYKHGEVGKNHLNSQRCLGGTSEKLTLDQIAQELGISKRELQRSLSIERNLTESMKELLDFGVITILVTSRLC